MVRRFCCAKSVACGRVIEREWGDPQRFPPHTPPSLRYTGVRTGSKTCGQSQKETPSDRMVFLFGMPRAGWNTLPRPARSASNPEVKAGLLRMALPFVGCREASSSLVYFAAQSAKNKGKPPFGRFSSDCRKSLSLRASPRREASALGALLGMTGVGLSTRCHHPTGWCFFSYSARRNSGFRSRRPSSAAAICPSRASRSPLRVPFSVR